MAKKNNKTDKLAQEAAKAMAAGMSYGKWKAMQPRVDVKTPVIPDGWKTCEYCGKAFKPVQRKRFCDAVCRQEAYKAHLRAAYHQRKLKSGREQ